MGGWQVVNGHNQFVNEPRLCRLPIQGSGPCALCGHVEELHVGEGFYDGVTEPEFRPSPPNCMVCEIDRKSLNDTAYVHGYQPSTWQHVGGSGSFVDDANHSATPTRVVSDE